MIKAAAVSDFRPSMRRSKRSSGREAITLELEPTADILREVVGATRRAPW